jgi:hypothetical protein
VPLPSVSTAIEWVDPDATDLAGPLLRLLSDASGSPASGCNAERPFGAAHAAAKAQLIGPLTMAALGVRLGQQPLTPDSWVQAVAAMQHDMPSLTELWLDEPVLDAAQMRRGAETLRQTLRALHTAHPQLILGVHTCASTPPLDVRGLPLDVLHLDVHAPGFDATRLLLPPDAEFVPGIVPTLSETTAEQLGPLLQRIAAQLPVRRIAPSCGLGLLSPARAAAVLGTLDELSYAPTGDQSARSARA